MAEPDMTPICEASTEQLADELMSRCSDSIFFGWRPRNDGTKQLARWVRGDRVQCMGLAFYGGQWIKDQLDRAMMQQDEPDGGEG